MTRGWQSSCCPVCYQRSPWISSVDATLTQLVLSQGYRDGGAAGDAYNWKQDVVDSIPGDTYVSLMAVGSGSVCVVYRRLSDNELQVKRERAGLFVVLCD